MECMLKHSSGDNVKQVLTTLDEYLRCVVSLLYYMYRTLFIFRSLNSTEKCLESLCSTGVDLLLPVSRTSLFITCAQVVCR